MLDELIAGFDENIFCRFLNSKFGGSFSASRSQIPLKKEFAWESAERLGIVKTLAGSNNANMPLLAIAVKLPDGETLKERSSRIKQFNFAKQILDDAMSNPASGVDGVLAQGLFVFYDEHGNFRLSLVFGKAEGTRLVWSTAKRLSFYVEAKAGNKTFRDRTALDWSSFDKLKDAFSVEKLTKEFYGKLFAWYQRAMDSDKVIFPNDVVKDKEAGEVKSEQIIRLITRLMFVWFLKQKHLVPDNLFDPAELKTILNNFNPLAGENYYRAILQNLFFATLNSEIEKRAFAVDAGNKTENREHFDIKTLYRYGKEFAGTEKEVLKLFNSIPFLNGGLFECLDRGSSYFDGFSRATNKQAKVPNQLFFDESEGLIPLLNQYHFTVEENSPGDEEVALDPELLGKVFENLLGAYNPETKLAARNATGSFYTPREIVNYMVDESLKAHVSQRVAQTFLSVTGSANLAVSQSSCEVAIQKLFATGERPADKKLCDAMDKALVTAKIFDPACGSGAFPMGILLRMVELLRILRNIPEDESVYDLKLELIENCIYGGDIQCIAVQITKLRFFISLVCEESNTDILVCENHAATQAGMPVLPCPENNYGIHTLPNLETKFVAADSLIGLKKPEKENTEGKISIDMFSEEEDPEIKRQKDELWKIRHAHFMARSYREKRDLRAMDKKMRNQLAETIQRKDGYLVDSAELMAAWDPYDQNTSAPFFDPEWMFNVKNGFDVVIGNPPYFNLSTVDKTLVNYLKLNYGEIHTGYNDIVYYFLCLSLRMLSSSGTAAFITSNYYLGNEYAQKLRLVLSPHLKKIINFKDYQVFSEASIHTCITFLSKDERNPLVPFYVATEDQLSADNQLEQLMRCIVMQRDDLKENWIISDPQERKIISKLHDTSLLLGNIADIAKGPETGNNEVFTLSENEIVQYGIEKEVTRRYIKNSHIARYVANWEGRFLLYADGNFSEKRHPNAFAYLTLHHEVLTKRRGPRTNEYEWWRLHRPSAKALFDAPEKIVVPYRAASNRFAYDDEQHFNDGGDIRAIVLKDTDFSYKYVLGLLNSCLLDWFYGFIGKPKGNAREYFNKPLALIPIKKPLNQTVVTKIESFVNRILATKKTNPSADTSALEAEIDQLVYKLYGLTPEEIAIVEAGVGQKEGSTGIPASGEASQAACGEASQAARGEANQAARGEASQTQARMPVLPSKKKRKAKLPPSQLGWD